IVGRFARIPDRMDLNAGTDIVELIGTYVDIVIGADIDTAGGRSATFADELIAGHLEAAEFVLRCAVVVERDADPSTARNETDDVALDQHTAIEICGCGGHRHRLELEAAIGDAVDNVVGEYGIADQATGQVDRFLVEAHAAVANDVLGDDKVVGGLGREP